MESTQNRVCRHRNRHTIISILLLLVSSSTHLRFIAEAARPVTSNPAEEAAPLVRGHAVEENVGGVVVVVNARQIGSSPPRCERRCGGCGHCVAVQVPVGLQVQSHSKIRSHGSSLSASTTKNVAYSRGDDITNYKPMSWKCKCGDLLFNP